MPAAQLQSLANKLGGLTGDDPAVPPRGRRRDKGVQA
jgi:hypothetical protein